MMMMLRCYNLVQDKFERRNSLHIVNQHSWGFDDDDNSIFLQEHLTFCSS